MPVISFFSVYLNDFKSFLSQGRKKVGIVWQRVYWRCIVGREDVKAHYEQEGLVQFVIDSVYALAHAVHNLLAAHCPKGDFKQCLDFLYGEEVLKYIRNVSFKGVFILAYLLNLWQLGKEACAFARL